MVAARSLVVVLGTVVLSLGSLGVGGEAGAGAPLIWSAIDAETASGETRNRRLDAVPKRLVRFNHDDVSNHFANQGERKEEEKEETGDVFESSASGSSSGTGSGAVEVVSMRMPTFDGGEVDCELRRSRAMAPALSAKFPELQAWEGPCSDGSQLIMNADERVDGLSASIVLPDGVTTEYVDSAVAGTDEYFIYRTKDAPRASGDDSVMSCEVEEHADELEAVKERERLRVLEAVRTKKGNRRSLRGGPARRLQTSSVGYVFRIAMIANQEYSAFHGDNLPQVLAALVTLMQRVNGIYSREIGVFFELVADTDQLICLSNSGTACDDLPNDSSVINLNQGFISSQAGLGFADYDIGHSVSTGSGGLASFPGFCDNSRARGTTGIGQPFGDPFAVDFVAHELGHQTLGGHSFRDCEGTSDGNQSPDFGVEPGSGISIMGYAGICDGGKNVAFNSEPFFGSLNLEFMRLLVENRASNPGCGTTFSTGQARPEVTAAATCTVPASQAFQLRGFDADTPASPRFYGWSRVDPSNSALDFEGYLDLSVGRFRPWQPTASKDRFHPNIHYLINGVSQREEVLPSTDSSMVMRFLGRELYDAAATASAPAASIAGDFGFSDLAMTFDADVAPMRLPAGLGSATLVPLQNFAFSWTVGGTAALTSTVDILIAENLFNGLSGLIDYPAENVDLNWVLVGRVPNTGSATLEVPQLVENSQINVNVMIRSTNDALGSCFFLDMVGDVTLAAVVTPPLSTNAPTDSPTDAPTFLGETLSPTLAPTLAPTGTPTVATPSPTLAPGTTTAPTTEDAFVFFEDPIVLGGLALGGLFVFAAALSALIVFRRRRRSPMGRRPTQARRPTKKNRNPMVNTGGPQIATANPAYQPQSYAPEYRPPY